MTNTTEIKTAYNDGTIVAQRFEDRPNEILDAPNVPMISVDLRWKDLDLEEQLGVVFGVPRHFTFWLTPVEAEKLANRLNELLAPSSPA